MAEHGRFDGVVRGLKSNGGRVAVGVVLGVAAIPAIQMVVGETRPRSDSTGPVVLNGVMPPEDNFRSKRPGTSPNGKKID